MNPCEKIQQEQLSGYLDGELTQAEHQAIRIHLEDCSQCRQIYEEMNQFREVSMKTRFEEPDDSIWSELPQTPTSGFLRGLGWLVVIIWGAAMSGYGLYEFFTGDEEWVKKLMVFAVISGPALLFLSVLLDRLSNVKSDPYRRVKK